MVTDEIDTFTEKGVLLQSGSELTADLIVTATGLNIRMLGDIAFTIDGTPLDVTETVSYRGIMFTGVPNLAWIFGYFRRPGRCGPTSWATSCAVFLTIWTSSGPSA